MLAIPAPGKFALVERPYPNIKAGYAVIKTEIAPVCLEGSRIWTNHEFEELYGGCQSDYPDGLGHEGVGTIDAVLPGSGFKTGDRVIAFQGDYCGQCFSCSNGLSPTYCDSNTSPKAGMTRAAMAGIQDWNQSESGGWAMAHYRIVPEANLYRIPNALEFKYAAAANCSVGVGWSNQQLMQVIAGQTVLVGGIGFIAMGHIASALHRNARVIALVRNDYRKGILEQMGVEHFIDPDDDTWLEQVLALTPRGQGVDHAVECSGAPYYQDKMFEATRVYGNINFSGHTPGAHLEFSPLDRVTHKAHRLTGQHDVRSIDRDGLVNCLLDPRVQKQIDAMVTHEFPMSRAGEAFDIQASKQCGKIYLYTQQ